MSSNQQPTRDHPVSVRIEGRLLRWLERGPLQHPKRWFAILLGIMLLALALPVGYSLYLRWRWALPVESARPDRVFLALGYRVGSATHDPATPALTPERWQEHVTALQAAGFRFVGLHDLQALLRQGTALPRRAVLVCLEIDRETRDWAAWQRVIVTARGQAVLFVDPRDPVPGWGALRQAIATPHWDVAIACPPDESSDPPLPEARHPYERFRSMETAAATRLRRLRTNLRRPFPTPVMALAHPRRTDIAADDAVHDLRVHLLARNAAPFFDLGFIDGDLAVNTRHSDALRLNRLAIDPAWNGRDLVARLEQQSTPRFTLTTDTADPEPAAWIRMLGTPRLSDGALRLSAEAGDENGVWLAGSQVLNGFSTEITLTVRRGVLSIPFLTGPNPSSRWDLRLASTGEISLHHIIGRQDRRIATDRWPAGDDPTSLRLIVRRNRVRIEVAGHPRFNGWIALDGAPSSGRLGLRISGDRQQPADAVVTALRMGPEQHSIALWDSPRETIPGTLAWLIEQGTEMTAFSAPLHRLAAARETGRIGETELFPLFRTAARIYHWDFVPHLTLQHPAELSHWPTERLTAQLEALDSDGLLVRFSDSAEWPIASVTAWLRSVADGLNRQGRRLLIRLPEALAAPAHAAAILAVIPGEQRVVPVSAPAARHRGAAVEIPVPDPLPVPDTALFFDLLADDGDPAAAESGSMIQQWRDDAEERYGQGDLEGAIALWFDWHAHDALHPLPLRRIGDALHRLGFQDESIDLYQQSLDRDPGNIDLAVQLAEWLDASGQTTRARNLLQTYALLFPDHLPLMMAQAEWLYRRGRADDSLRLLYHILEQEPDHLAAALRLAILAPTAEAQRMAAERMLRLGREPANRIAVLRAIRDGDLLARPGGDRLLTLLTAPVSPTDTELAKLVADLTPRNEWINSVAGPDQPLPPAEWHNDGGRYLPDPGRFRIRADTSRESVTLRLSGTERWLDEFIEADVVEVRGEFWLEARRSRDQMIRFGFDDNADQLHLQIWIRRDGEMRLVQNQSKNWPIQSAAGGLRLRLEIRGNGAIGYVDGETWGLHPLALPAALSSGWVGVTVRSIVPGEAEMALRQLSGGPIFPAIAHPRDVADGEAMDRQSTLLRGLASVLNGVSPGGFAIAADGSWSSRVQDHDDFLRLFAKYHGLRLLLWVEVHAETELRAADLIRAAGVHGADGFILKLAQAPTAAQRAQLDQDLADTHLIVLLAHTTNGAIRLDGCGRARLLLPGDIPGREVRDLPADQPGEWRTPHRTGPIIIRL